MLVVDLRVAQAYRERGISRYSQSLVVELARARPGLDVACLLDPDGEPPLRIADLERHARIVYGTGSLAEGGTHVSHFLQAGPFDRRKGVADLFPPELASHRPRLGAVVYDLIPWIFPDDYLADPADRLAYDRVLAVLPRLDRLFAISESVRDDVVAIAGAAPSSVVTIHGGVDPDRWSPAGGAADEGGDLVRSDASPGSLPAPAVSDATLVVDGRGSRHVIRPPFWLYVGGDDPRKNLDRLIEAVALLKRRDRLHASLVVACSIQEERAQALAATAASRGLRPGVDIVFTGYVPDDVLGALFSACAGTVFPSLYEGLGLPVLESYAFGRPALVSDSSALREVAPSGCRFDPTSAGSIADALDRLATDPGIARESLAFGRSVLALHAWRNAAGEVAEWLDEPPNPAPAGPVTTAAPVPSVAAGIRSAPPGIGRSAPPLWVASSLPPDESGVAFYTQRSLGAPASPVTFFVPGRSTATAAAARDALARLRHDAGTAPAPVDVLPLGALRLARRRQGSTPVVFVLGNSPHHRDTLAHMLRHPLTGADAVHLHDVYIGDLLRFAFGSTPRLRDALQRTYEATAVAAWVGDGEARGDREPELLGPRLLVRHAGARRFIVNSQAAAARLRADLGGDGAGGDVDIEVLFLPILPPLVEERRPDPGLLRVGHFGILGPRKRIDALVSACDMLAARRPLELVLAGYEVGRYIASVGLGRPYMRAVEAPSDVGLQEQMAAVTCAVQLRTHDFGESSGVVNQLLALRTPMICTRLGSMAELDGVATLVDVDIRPAELARVIEATAAAGWPSRGDGLLAQRTAGAFETRLRDAICLGPGS